MPNINIPNTPLVDGATADADSIMADVYSPHISPNSLEVINGKLTNANRNGWTITRDDVRGGHFSQSNTVAATANQDYFDDFLTLTNTGTVGRFEEQSMAIPGCSISFFVPWTVSAVSLSWHLSVITDCAKTAPIYAPGTNFSNEGKTWLMLFIDGYPVTTIRRFLFDGNQTMAYSPSNPDTFYNHYTVPDTRDWSGSFIYDYNTSGILPGGAPRLNTKGWHTASIRVAFPPVDEVGGVTIPGSGVNQVRVKTRRMGYSLIR